MTFFPAPLRRIPLTLACSFSLLLAHSGAHAAPAADANKLSGPTEHTVTPVDWIAAVVNDQVITHRELADRVKAATARMKGQNLPLPPEADLKRQVLERMVMETAQLQLAKDEGIRIDDSMLDNALTRIAQQNSMGLAQFKAAVAAEGLSFAEVRENIRTEITLQRLRERDVDNKVQITDADVDQFIKQQANRSQSQDEFNLAEILIRVPENANPAQISAQRDRAAQVMRELRTGAPFAQLAATYSDAGTALKGGEIGWKTLSSLPELFANTLSNLTPGQNTGIIRTPYGFYILQVVNRRASAQSATSTPAMLTNTEHILIKVSPTMSATDARDKIEQIRQMIEDKKLTFEQAAREYSQDSSAAKGGDLGWIAPGDTVPAFEKAMDALQPGQISEPIESPFGFHLIKVLGRKVAENQDEQKRKEAKAALRERKIMENYEEFLRQLHDSAYIDIRKDA